MTIHHFAHRTPKRPRMSIHGESSHAPWPMDTASTYSADSASSSISMSSAFEIRPLSSVSSSCSSTSSSTASSPHDPFCLSHTHRKLTHKLVETSSTWSTCMRQKIMVRAQQQTWPAARQFEAHPWQSGSVSSVDCLTASATMSRCSAGRLPWDHPAGAQ